MTKWLVTFVRHGETHLNKERVLQGQIKPDPPLNDTGRQQGSTLGKFWEDRIFTHVYSSDLNRAHTTCRLIMDENLDFKANKSPKIMLDERIRERSFGVFEGTNYGEYTKQARLSGEDIRHYKPPKGESYLEVQERAKQFFEDVCSEIYQSSQSRQSDTPFPSANVLVVSHGATLRTIFDYLKEDIGCQLDVKEISNTARFSFEIVFPCTNDTVVIEKSQPIENMKSKLPWLNGMTVKCLEVNGLC